jgi:hypothetical protein
MLRREGQIGVFPQPSFIKTLKKGSKQLHFSPQL